MMHIHLPKHHKINPFFGILLPILISIAYVEIDIGFIPAIPYAFILILICSCLLYYLLQDKAKLDSVSLSFLLFLPLTILLASPDSIFRSWERFLGFAVVFFIASPLFENNAIRKFRRYAFYSFVCVAAVIGIISFFAYFLGINYMDLQVDIEEGYEVQSGRFSGITRQSMMLGPLAGIGALGSLYLVFRTRQYLWLLPFIPCAGSVMFSASRSALIAFVLGTIIELYYLSHSSTRTKKMVLVLLTGIVLSFPLWNSALSGVKQKQLMHEDDKEFFDSRSDKFAARFQEFKSSPLWGVGFSAIDPSFHDNYGKNGTIEPGSSWLAVFSMTGLFGFFFFVRLFYRSMKTIRKRAREINVLFFSCFFLMSVHMLFEGYIFAIGNPLCFFFWLLIGLCYDAKFWELYERKCLK